MCQVDIALGKMRRNFVFSHITLEMKIKINMKNIQSDIKISNVNIYDYCLYHYKNYNMLIIVMHLSFQFIIEDHYINEDYY